MDTIKKHTGLILLSAIFVTLAVLHKDLFFILLLLYVFFIKFLLSDFLSNKARKIFTGILWSLFIVTLVMTVYVNYFLPHGPSYPIGDVVCRNDGRGPCEEVYKEDLSGLDIPGWAKFLRGSGGFALLFGSAFAGIVAGRNEEIEL